MFYIDCIANIHGVHSGKKDDDKKRKDVEEFNVGGAQSSTAVQRPIRTDDSLTGDLVSHARAAGTRHSTHLDAALICNVSRSV